MTVYYKATGKDGRSYHDHNYIYHIGLNELPVYLRHQAKASTAICYTGLHLAKDEEGLSKLRLDDFDELYEALPGVILSEDSNKVRCLYVWLTRKLTDAEISVIKYKIKRIDKIQDICRVYSKKNLEPLCGWDWLINNGTAISQADINNQSIVISSGNRTIKMKNNPKLKTKDVKRAIASVAGINMA